MIHALNVIIEHFTEIIVIFHVLIVLAQEMKEHVIYMVFVMTQLKIVIMILIQENVVINYVQKHMTTAQLVIEIIHVVDA